MKPNGNLFHAADAPANGERFETILKASGMHIERIVSSTTPDGQLYMQSEAEWVVLLKGSAVLEVAGESLTLAEGDHVHLAALVPHRVISTSAGAVWLAVHLPKPASFAVD